jgi:type I restriction enzyme S subunit
MSFESSYELMPLGKLAQFINGDRGENYPKPTDYVERGVPFISATDVDGGYISWDQSKQISSYAFSKLRGGKVQRGDILFCLRGSLGKLGWVEKEVEGAIASSLVILRSENLGLSRYLRFVLSSAQAQEAIKSLDNGSVQGNISAAALKGLQIPNPPEAARVAITSVLDSLETLIDLNRRINQTLEAMAQAIFKSWFVDFDPVKAKIAAKAEGRDPLRAAMTAISGKPDAELDTLPPDQFAPLAATAALFPDEMEASELGEIPKGWAYVAAESLSDVGIGKTPPRKEPQWFTEESGDWRWVSIKDMGAGTLYQQVSSEYLTKEAVSRFNVRVVPDNTVLLSFKLTVGRVAISDGELLTNEAIAHFKLPTDPVVSSEYLYLYLKGFDFASLGSTSSIADAVNSKTIRDLPVLLPSGELVARLGEAIRPMLQEIRSRQLEVRTLTETRDALLPKLLSGELGVSS